VWNDHPERWSCDSVSFYVEDYGWDSGWDYEAPGVYRDGRDYDDYRCYRDDWYDSDYGDDWGDGDRDWREPGRMLVHDRFRMNDCSDDYSCGFDAGSTDAIVEIDCVASSKGDPTEVVGRIKMKDSRGDDVLFRIDVDGDHGARPDTGRMFTRDWGGLRVEVEVTGYRLASTKPWQTARIKWIEFDVRVFGR